MSAVIKITLCILFGILISGCNETRPAEVAPGANGVEVFVYQDTANLAGFIAIRTENNGGRVSFTDEILSDDVDIGSEAGTFAIANGISLAFFIPPGFSDTVQEWRHGKCAYNVIGRMPYRSEIRGDTYLNSIESKCAGKDEIARYTYSTLLGLQAVAFGKMVRNLDGVMEFQTSYSYALIASDRGFGYQSLN